MEPGWSQLRKCFDARKKCTSEAMCKVEYIPADGAPCCNTILCFAGLRRKGYVMEV